MDQEKLGNEKCIEYFYYILEARKREMEKIKDLKTPRGGDTTGRTKLIQFPDDFVSSIDLKTDFDRRDVPE